MLKDDQKEPAKGKNRKQNHPTLAPSDPDECRPRGIFNKAYITPDQWKQVSKLIKILRVSYQLTASASFDMIVSPTPSFPIQEFETLTKVFEANAPTGSVVIREYVKLKRSLQNKIDSCTSRSDPLFPMYHAMLVRIKAYLDEALQSDVLVLATILHPCWRADYFQFAFGEYSTEFEAAKRLIGTAFDTRKAKLEAEVGQNNNTDQDSHDGEDDDDDGFRAHRKKFQPQIENELANYLDRVDEPSKQVEKDPTLALEWWKV